MKKGKNLKQTRAFICGVMVTLLVCGCMTAALAASGSVRFNAVEVSFNRKTLFPKGKSLTAENGTAIPSTILYTDEKGGGTTYVPIRVLTEALHMRTTWLESIGTLDVGLSGDQELYMLALNCAGTEWVDLAEEVEPILPDRGTTLVDGVRHQGPGAFEKEFSLNQRDGDFLSITVSNQGDYPLRFDLGFRSEDGFVYNHTQVPAGAAVTRTMKVISMENLKESPITMRVDGAEGTAHDIDAVVTAVQFK